MDSVAMDVIGCGVRIHFFPNAVTSLKENIKRQRLPTAAVMASGFRLRRIVNARGGRESRVSPATHICGPGAARPLIGLISNWFGRGAPFNDPRKTADKERTDEELVDAVYVAELCPYPRDRPIFIGCCAIDLFCPEREREREREREWLLSPSFLIEAVAL